MNTTSINPDTFDRRRSSVPLLEQTVLAAPQVMLDASKMYAALAQFRGYDNEDFMRFSQILNDYIGIKNISNDKQKTALLRALLIGKARVDFDHLATTEFTSEAPTYEKWIEILTEKYNTIEIIERKKDAFYNINQLPSESPNNYLNRLVEAAAIANVTDDLLLYSRFRHRLLPEYQEHCLSLGAQSHKDYLRFAQGYYNSMQLYKHHHSAIGHVGAPVTTTSSTPGTVEHHHRFNNSDILLPTLPSGTQQTNYQPVAYRAPVNGLHVMDQNINNTQINHLTLQQLTDLVQYAATKAVETALNQSNYSRRDYNNNGQGRYNNQNRRFDNSNNQYPRNNNYNNSHNNNRNNSGYSNSYNRNQQQDQNNGTSNNNNPTNAPQNNNNPPTAILNTLDNSFSKN